VHQDARHQAFRLNLHEFVESMFQNTEKELQILKAAAMLQEKSYNFFK